MKKTDWLWAALLVFAAVAGVAYYLHRQGELDNLVAAVQPIDSPSVPLAPASSPVPTPSAAAEAAPENPVPATAPAAPSLPPLADSDAAVRSALESVFAPGDLDAYLVPRYVVRRFVATIDSLPKETLPSQLRPIRPVGGALVVNRTVEADAERVWLSQSANAERYGLLVALVDRLDTRTFSDFYFRHYPLFQQAYTELGSRRYFNDRFIEVIDHLLAAPSVNGPIELVRVRSTWQFADPGLERLSAGHKAMLRLGPDHGQIVRAKLSALRTQLAAQPR